MTVIPNPLTDQYGRFLTLPPDRETHSLQVPITTPTEIAVISVNVDTLFTRIVARASIIELTNLVVYMFAQPNTGVQPTYLGASAAPFNDPVEALMIDPIRPMYVPAGAVLAVSVSVRNTCTVWTSVESYPVQMPLAQSQTNRRVDPSQMF